MNLDSPEPSSAPNWHRWIGPLIFFIAFGFRLIGIGWGLPNALHNQSYHPDEQVIWQFSQGIEPAKLDFAPGVYNYGTLYLTTLRVASDMVTAYSGGPDPKDPDSVWDYLGRCHFAGRLISAISGAVLAVIVLFMCRRFVSTFGATLAGLSLAFAPSLVVHSRFQTTDVFATMLFASSLALALKLFESTEDGWDKSAVRLAAVSGLLAGLSAGAKYTGILALATLFAACYLAKRGPWIKAACLGAFASILGFLVATPGVFVDSERFWRDFKYEMIHTSTGHGLHFVGVSNGFLYQFGNVLTGLSPLVGLIGIVGLGIGFQKKAPQLAALLPSFLLYFVLIGRADVLFMRYTFPLYIALAIGFGYAAGLVAKKTNASIALGALFVFAVGGAATVAGRWTESMTNADPRDLAAIYIKNEAKGKDWTLGLVSDPWYYTPPLFKNTALVRGLFVQQMEEAAQITDPKIVRATPTNPEERVDWDIRLFDQNPELIAFSSFEAGDVARLVQNNHQPLPPDAVRFRDFLARLEENYDEISPGATKPTLDRLYRDGSTVHDMHYVRPYVYLWKRKGL